MRGRRVRQRSGNVTNSRLTHPAALRLRVPGFDRWPLERGLLIAVVLSGPFYGLSPGILLGGQCERTALIFNYFILFVRCWLGNLFDTQVIIIFKLHIAQNVSGLAA